MAAKIFRDPLYNYISLDRDREAWLIKLLDTSEVQRLRRIHQLGVSYLTYPGADHNRLAHSLGVVHLMQQAIKHLETVCTDARAQVDSARNCLLAAALVHDVGHGPFSHLFEPCLGIDHEYWSKRVVFEDSSVNRVLKAVSPSLPREVAALIDTDNHEMPAWAKSLISSQLDMDRLDYLRRDSLFTGAGYGHFDHFRLLNTFVLHTSTDDRREIVWGDKSLLAIEEYIFSRYYMYQNVYLHKTTRGFEKLLEAMWRRAKSLYDGGADVTLVPVIREFWTAGSDGATVQQYLRIEEYTVLQQIQNWTSHDDKPLADLARRFLARDRFAMIEPPPANGLAPNHEAWHAALCEVVAKDARYAQTDMYCLPDRMKAKYNQPYFPEKEADEQSVSNAIRVLIDGAPVEVSSQLARLKALTETPVDRMRYYVPRDVLPAAKRLRAEWKGS